MLSLFFADDELYNVQADIHKVETKIEKIEGDIIAAKSKESNADEIHQLQYKEKQLREEKKQLRDKEKQLREEKKQLRDKEKQLRDKEKQLRDKEKQLRDEKYKLLEIQSKLLDQRVLPPSPSGSFSFVLYPWVSSVAPLLPGKLADDSFRSFDELFAAYIPSSRAPPPLSLSLPIKTDDLDFAGNYFPFKDRTTSRKLLVESIQKQYDLWSSRSTLDKEWYNRSTLDQESLRRCLSHILVGGAPGTFSSVAFYFLDVVGGNLLCVA